jgi:transposase
MYEVSKCAPQEALRNLDSAFSHFYRRCQLKQHGRLKGKVGYPQRKTKKRGLGSFRLTGSIAVFPSAIQLPRLGRLRLKERDYLPTQAKIRSATVSEQAGHWYVSVLVQQERVAPVHRGSVVGVDLGVKTLATLSDGTTEPNPRHLRSCLKKLKRLQRAVSRKPKGSRNRRKAAQRLGTAGENQVNRGDRGSPRRWHAQEPSSRASDRGCGMGRVPAPTGLQSGVVWLSGAPRQSVGALLEDVFGVRVGGRGPDAGRPPVLL